MLQLAGTYYQCRIHLEKLIRTDHPIKVVVMFEEGAISDESNRLKLADFSFAKSRKITEGYKGSFSDTLIEERRSEL